MIKTILKFTFIFFLLIQSNLIFARSLEWQKVTLQNEIRDKVTDAIDNVILGNQFFVDVQIKYLKPNIPEFEDVDDVKTRVSDIEFDDSKGDYIAFSKIGLEVPVLEKYYDENQNKLKEMFQYNQLNDLFTQLESIKIKILLSSELNQQLIEKVQNLIQSIDFSYGDKKPKIDFQVIDISKVIKMTDEEKKKQGAEGGGDGKNEVKNIHDKKFNLLDWLSKFGNAIGLVIAVLLLGLFSWLILKKYFELKKELLDMEKAPEEKTAEELEAEEAAKEEEEEEEEEIIKTREDFGRFKQFMQEYPEDTTLMIKRWIGEVESNPRYELILRAIVQQLEDNEIKDLINSLNDNEKSKWKSHLDQFLTKDELIEANKTLSEEVVREIVSPNASEDPALTDMLINLKESQAIQFVNDHPSEAKVLFNLLSPVFSAKVLNKIDESLTARAIEDSMNYDPRFDQEGVARFKKRLTAFVKEHPDRPFNQKIIEMLQSFDPAKENILYRYLAKEGKRSEIIMAGTKQFPAQLISQLSSEAITDIMQVYPTDEKVSLLLSLDKMKADQILEKFAPVGTKAREVLSIEFNSIESNELRSRQIERNRDKYWKDFVKFTRDHLNANTEFKVEIRDLVTNWADQLLDPDYDEDFEDDEDYVAG
jgi:hypothetical protein